MRRDLLDSASAKPESLALLRMVVDADHYLPPDQASLLAALVGIRMDLHRVIELLEARDAD